MNKKIKVMAAAAIMTLCMSTTSLAYNNPVDDLKDALVQMGIPSKYYGNIVEHLQKIKISQSQADSVMGKLNEAKSIIGSENDLSKLPADSKVKLQQVAVEAGKVVDLNVKFGKDSKGVTTLAVTTSAGGTLLQLNTLEMIDVVKNFDMSTIIEVFEEAIDFSNDPNKGQADLDGDGKPDFVPEGGGDLNDTATPYGNLMLGGASMVGMAGGLHYVGRKKQK